MSKNEHTDMMEELTKHFKPVFEKSPDGVYIWLDEQNMIANNKLAKMFGYGNAKEMCSKASFLDAFVHKDDREMFSENYGRCIENMSFPATFRFRGIRKDKSSFLAETDMIPICFDGHAIAYHFVRELR